MKPKATTAVDTHVAARLEVRRKQLRMSQLELSKRLGISYQQIYKYSSGVNRMSSGRLYQMAQELGVSVSYFFEGL